MAAVVGCIATLIAESVVRLSSSMLRSPLQGLENQVVDLAFQTRSNNLAHNQVNPEQIVIIDIDDASIEQLGRPQLWPRAYDAFAINHVASGNPKAIGIDYLYTESDSLPPVYTTILEMRGFSNSSEIIESLSTDAELVSAVEQAGNVE